MNGAALASFRGRLQTFAENLFPTTITIGAQAYDCATSGLRRTVELGLGFEQIPRVAFSIDRQKFADAGQPEPRENTPVIWEGVTYLVEEVAFGNPGTQMLLRCKGATR